MTNHIKSVYLGALVMLSIIVHLFLFWNSENAYFRPGLFHEDGMPHIDAAKILLKHKSELMTRKSIQFHSKRVRKYCMIIPTIKRKGNPHYLTNLVASLVKNIPKPQWKDIHLAIMHMQKRNFDEVDFLKDYVHVLRKPTDIYRGYIWNTQLEAVDYTFALEYCYKTNSPYIIVVEDDSELISNPFDHLNATLSEIESNGSWIWLKFYLLPKVMNWNHENGHEVILVSIMIALPILLVLISLILIFHHVNTSLTERIMIHVIISIIVALFLIFAGKQNISMQSGHSEHTEAISTVAQLYPRSIVPKIVQEIRNTEFNVESVPLGIDQRLGIIASKYNLKKYLFYPLQFKHTGRISSRT